MEGPRCRRSLKSLNPSTSRRRWYPFIINSGESVLALRNTQSAGQFKSSFTDFLFFSFFLNSSSYLFGSLLSFLIQNNAVDFEITGQCFDSLLTYVSDRHSTCKKIGLPISLFVFCNSYFFT